MDYGSPAALGGDPFLEAQRQYPLLRALGLAASPGNRLEYWPPGEPGTPDYPRPASLSPSVAGQEYPPTARPVDILGDAVSHHMIKTDAEVADFYNNFAASLTPEQHARLHDQYAHAVLNEGESRPFERWVASSGMPAYFRGYPFGQWPQDFNERAYTIDQRTELDRMMQYLRSGNAGQPTP